MKVFAAIVILLATCNMLSYVDLHDSLIVFLMSPVLLFVSCLVAYILYKMEGDGE